MIYFVYFSFSLTSHPVARKKNKFKSFHERDPDNHSQFQTKMVKTYTRFQTKTLGRHIPIYLI